MAEEEQEQELDKNKRIRPREQACGQKLHAPGILSLEVWTIYLVL